MSNVDSALPAVPGLYWYNDGVTMTADIQFQLSTAPTIKIGDSVTPTAHIANAPFSTSPSQYFTDLERSVSVVSPFALSRLTSATSNVTGTVTYTVELVNTDDTTREISLQTYVPDSIVFTDDALATTYSVPSSLEGDTVILTFVVEVTDPADRVAIAITNPTSGDVYTELNARRLAPTAVTVQTNSAATTTSLFLLLITVWMSALMVIHWVNRNKVLPLTATQ